MRQRGSLTGSPPVRPAALQAASAARSEAILEISSEKMKAVSIHPIGKAKAVLICCQQGQGDGEEL